jgi:hypothetical protein
MTNLVLRDTTELDWVYRWTKAGRHGQACRVVSRAKDKTVMVEFADGERMVLDLRSLRRKKPGETTNRA